MEEWSLERQKGGRFGKTQVNGRAVQRTQGGSEFGELERQREIDDGGRWGGGQGPEPPDQGPKTMVRNLDLRYVNRCIVLFCFVLFIGGGGLV